MARDIGDRQALIAAALEKRPQLIQTAMRIVHCRYLAEDVVQDTILRICEAPPDAPVQAPHSYLFRMVRNLAIDYARRVLRERRCQEPERCAEGLQGPNTCPQERMERCEALRAIAAALDEAPERTRRVFVAHRVDGVPQKQLAGELGVSPTLVNFMVRDGGLLCRAALDRLSADPPAPPDRPAVPGPRRDAPRRAVAAAVP